MTAFSVDEMRWIGFQSPILMELAPFPGDFPSVILQHPSLAPALPVVSEPWEKDTFEFTLKIQYLKLTSLTSSPPKPKSSASS